MTMASFEELLQCAICLERFTQPKVLPCQHTFCLKCLDDIIGDTKSVNCPTCRRKHNVPKSGVSGFNDNLMALNLLAMSGESADCGDCGKKQILSDCQHCHEQLCTDCRVAHKFLQGEITALIQSLKCDSLQKNGDLDTKYVAQSLQATLDIEASVHQDFQEAAHILNMRKKEILAQVQTFAKFQYAKVNGGSEKSVANELRNELPECRSIDGMKALKTALGTVGGILNRIDSRLELNVDLNLIFGFGELLCDGKSIRGQAASERLVESTVGGMEKRNVVTPQGQGPCGQVIDYDGDDYGRDQKMTEKFPRNVDYTAKKIQASKLIFGNAPLGNTPGCRGSMVVPSTAALFHPLFAIHAARENAVYCLTVNRKMKNDATAPEMMDLSGTLLRYGLSNGDWRIIVGNTVSVNDIAIQNSGDLLIIENHKLIRVQMSASCEPCGTTEQALFPICGHAAQIACHGQEYIILDSGKKCLLKFAEDGKLVREMKHEKFTELFSSNSRMCVGQKGSIYVIGARLTNRKDSACSYNRCSYKSGASVKWETTLLVITWEGKLIQEMAVDTGSYDSHKFKIDPQNQVYCPGPPSNPAMSFPYSGTSTNYSHYKIVEGKDANDGIIEDVVKISDVCVDANGFVSITLPSKNKIDVFDQALGHFCTLGDESRPDIFQEPYGVSLMPDGRMVVCDAGNNRVQII